MSDDFSSIESKVNRISNDIDELKKIPTQAVLDKTMQAVLQKLEDRDRIIDLEMKNMSNSIRLDIQTALSKSSDSLEKKIEQKIKDVVSNQKDKISWGIEILRFAIVAALFILSVKLIV
jgi:hypothetical protein